MVVNSPPIMKPAITIRCPDCLRPTEFMFASCVQIPTKDTGHFKKSKNFSVIDKVWVNSRYTNIALFYHGLTDSLENIRDLPDGYNIEMWRQKYWFANIPESLKNTGSYRCANCAVQKKHEVSWPEEAFFQIEYKGKVLWAYDRETALKLLSYIESKERIKNPSGGISQDWFLRKIPGHFQSAKARNEITKKLKKNLQS